MSKFAYRIIFTTLFLTSYINSTQDSNKKKCRVLALEGGGDKGAYQAGVIQGLTMLLPPDDIKWEVVTGISVGSLNGGGFSIFDMGKEQEAAEFLLKTWRDIKGKGDVFENWWLGPLYGLFNKNSLYSTEPLKKLVAKTINNETLKRKFIAGATKFQDGSYDVFDGDNLTKEQLQQVILSSSAFPIMFPNIRMNNYTYMDGGIKHGIDIASGINKCLDMNYKQEDIIVDVILCNTKDMSIKEGLEYNTFEVLERYLEISSYDSSMREVDQMKTFFPNVDYRYLVKPAEKLPVGPIPLNFSPAQIEEMIRDGQRDARFVIDDGPSAGFEKVYSEMREEMKKTMNRGRSNKSKDN